MTNDDIRLIIENDVNEVVNKTTFYKFEDDDIINYHIRSVIGTILEKYHYSNIREYIIRSNYPEVQVLIKYLTLEIAEIKVLKFERLNKLHKLNLLSNKA